MVPISIQYWYKPKAAKGEPEEPEPEPDHERQAVGIPHSTFHFAGHRDPRTRIDIEGESQGVGSQEDGYTVQ
jgi:hypothetical protein